MIETYSKHTPTGYSAKKQDNNTNYPIYESLAGDKNDTATGDNPERNGEITLKFTNGKCCTRCKNILNQMGTTQVGIA